MSELFLMESISNVKEVFGSCKILDEVDEVDSIAVCSFARIVANYMKMDRILNNNK